MNQPSNGSNSDRHRRSRGAREVQARSRRRADTDSGSGKNSRWKAWINKKTVGSAFAGIFMAVVTNWIIDWIDIVRNGPNSYVVYVVGGNKSDADDFFIRDVYQAIQKTWKENEPLTIGDKLVRIEYVADRWDPQQASEVSKKIAGERDALMVIGHFSSSTTGAALKNYLAVDPMIPVIMTTETNPDLIPETHKDAIKRLPILRLWPTDEQQATDIARYATEGGDKTFWVVEDSRINPVYSHYLAEKIIEELQRKKRQVVLWTNDWYVPPANTLKQLGVQSVFFPGHSTNALVFVSQMKAIWKRRIDREPPPRIFLTDAAVGNIIQGDTNGEVEGVYVTHPELEACKSIKKQRGHKYLAKDAALIAYWIVEKARSKLEESWWRKVFLAPSVGDAREALNDVIKEDIKENNEQLIGYKSPDRPSAFSVYEFNAEGNRENAKFSLWQIREGEFVRIKEAGNEGLTPEACR
jgi:hypothetical protein